jgi:very-short-patch-repair endonuclease
LGYDVKRQIGASGFRVDLAVSDPDKPGRFTLGIECDGAQFHSSRSARDRDRLRQQVLEAHGWIIHRVWSADWYLRPQAELKKIEDAVAAARAEWAARDEDGYKPARAVPVSFQAERVGDDLDVVTAVMEAGSAFASDGNCYVEADFPVNRSIEPHLTPMAQMAAYVVKVVEAEGPVHLDEITARIRILWGLGRAGSRIRAAVERAAKAAAQHGLIVGGPFYSTPEQAVVTRDRSLVGSLTLRKPEALPPDEIDHTLLTIVDANFGAGRDDLVQAASRAFGFAATSAQLREVLHAGIGRLEASGAVTAKGDLIVRKAAA